MKRYTVELSCSVEIDVDESAMSDWDGSTLMNAHLNPERFIPGSTHRDVIGALGIVVGVEGRSVGGTDGWADWPNGAVRCARWPDWIVERVHEHAATQDRP